MFKTRPSRIQKNDEIAAGVFTGGVSKVSSIMDDPLFNQLYVTEIPLRELDPLFEMTSANLSVGSSDRHCSAALFKDGPLPEQRPPTSSTLSSAPPLFLSQVICRDMDGPEGFALLPSGHSPWDAEYQLEVPVLSKSPYRSVRFCALSGMLVRRSVICRPAPDAIDSTAVGASSAQMCPGMCALHAETHPS